MIAGRELAEFLTRTIRHSPASYRARGDVDRQHRRQRGDGRPIGVR
jgi:hypothetical protein